MQKKKICSNIETSFFFFGGAKVGTAFNLRRSIQYCPSGHSKTAYGGLPKTKQLNNTHREID